MRKEASLELWKTLYHLIDEIRELAPWKELYDMDLIGIQENGREEPVFCSVMGHEVPEQNPDVRQYPGVCLYEGTEGLACFQQMMSVGMEENLLSADYIVGDQQSLMLQWGERIHVPEQQLAVIKELGLKYHGKGNWPYVLSLKPRFAPYTPDEAEVRLLIETFVQLIEAVNALRENRAEVDFEKGEFCFRYFDLEQMNWMTAPARLPYVEEDCGVYEITDQALLEQLKTQPGNDQTLLLDAAYLTGELVDENYDRPLNPLACLMAEVESHKIVFHELIMPDEEEGRAAGCALICYIQERGLPKRVRVRNPRVAAGVSDLCQRLSIPLESGPLPQIDGIVEQLRRQTREIKS